MKFYKKTKFWKMLRDTLGLITGPSVIGLHELGAADIWMRIACITGLVGAIMAIWVVDQDNNGIVDIFEDKPE